MNRARRLFGVLVVSGFRAAPGLAAFVFALNLASRLALMLAPVAVGAFVNAAAHHDHHALAVDAVLVAVTMAGSAGAMTIAAITRYGGLHTRVALPLPPRLAPPPQAAPCLSH